MYFGYFWNYIQSSLVLLYLSRQNDIYIVGKVGCILYLEALFVGFLGGSVLKVDISGAMKKKRAAAGFGLQLML